MVAKIVIFSVVIGMSLAATWRGRLPAKPKELEDKEGCYISEINDVLPFGQEVTPIGFCYRIGCGRHMVDYASCGVIGISDESASHCFVTKEDLSKPYPSCCPQIKCLVDNSVI